VGHRRDHFSCTVSDRIAPHVSTAYIERSDFIPVRSLKRNLPAADGTALMDDENETQQASTDNIDDLETAVNLEQTSKRSKSSAAVSENDSFLKQTLELQEKQLNASNRIVDALEFIGKELSFCRAAYCAVNNLKLVDDSNVKPQPEP
jgi:hypothetical protein